jgi:hypothetical protein
MIRFLGGLNEEISDFIEMFPYHTLQDLVDQAMCTERKKISKRHVKDLVQAIPLQPHGASSSPVLFLWGRS